MQCLQGEETYFLHMILTYFRPYSASELAVGCNHGVILWRIDPKSSSTRIPRSCATILSDKNHKPVTSLQWKPKVTTQIILVF